MRFLIQLRQWNLAVQVPGYQVSSKLGDAGEEDAVNAERPRGCNVGRNVIDEDGLLRLHAETLECVLIDRRIRLGRAQLAGPGKVSEAGEPVEVLAHVG